MMLSEVAVVLVRVTLLFAAALLFLRTSKRLPPRIRHLACVSAMCMALMTLLTALSPEYPVFTVRALEVPDVGEIRIASFSSWTWARLIGAAWACGFAAVLLRFLTGTAILWRTRRKAVPLDTDTRVLSADVSVPMVAGLFRPAILLPRDAANWSEERRDAALRHERGHLRRQDLWLNFFGLFVCAIYWFHPLAWILFRRSREEQEAACDDLVVEHGFDRAAYAEALLDAGRSARRGGIPVASCPMLRPGRASRSMVKERILRVLSPREPMAPKSLRRWQSAIGGGAILVFGMTSALGTEPIFTPGATVTSPVIVRKISPAYTNAAMAAKIQGTVRLSVVVGDNGAPRDIVVTRGIDPGLDRNAVAAVRSWKLQPAMRNGTPVAVRARVEMNFRLK